MHTMNPDAHGLAAMAILNGLLPKLIGKGVIGKAEMLEICAAVKKTYDARGVKHDNAAETDASLLAASLMTEIESRF